MQTCRVFDLHLATGLLRSDLTVRNAGRPQRGPWPTPLTIAVGVAVLVTGYGLWRRFRPGRR
jgi:hypothetical protein